MNESSLFNSLVYSFHEPYLLSEEEENKLEPKFDLNEFKSITSIKNRLSYVTNRLGKVGRGSSRIVFKLPANKVIKIARNLKGMAQNKAEIDISGDGFSNEIIAKVFDHDINGSWLEAEFASPLTEHASIFKEIMGFRFDEFALQIQNWSTTSFKRKNDQIAGTDLFSHATDLINNYNLPWQDLVRKSSWGIVERNGQKIPVIIDYGLTQEVYEKFYSFKDLS